MTYLIIPFEAKDELKKKYNLKWNAKLKLWYIDEMVDALKPYTIIPVNISYDDNDYFKGLLKSLRWDAIRKTWTCSFQDSLIFSKMVSKNAVC